jgi:hypothetical protein
MHDIVYDLRVLLYTFPPESQARQRSTLENPARGGTVRDDIELLRMYAVSAVPE